MTESQYIEIFENQDIHPQYKSAVLSAMKEAVEKGSIGFNKWLFDNKFAPNKSYLWFHWDVTPEEARFYTIQELYQEYLKSIK